MAALNSEVKGFMVQALACFDTPSQVAAAVREEFGIEVTRQQCEAQDPTKRAGRDLAKKWVTLFHDTRKRFREETADIPIANRSFRLRAMNRFVEKAETMKNIGLAMQILEQAAKETGDIYVNRARKEEAGDEPVIPTRIRSTWWMRGSRMPSLNVPQAQFLTLPHKFRAFVAGFGSGKTWVGCSALSKHFMEWPGVNAGYFAPTYPQIRDIFYPTMDEVAYDWGLKTKINQANHEVHIYSGRQYRGTVICRSMEKPQTIVGFKIGHALVDELDVLTAVKAQQAWRKIIARMRYNLPGLKNRVDVTTTPEGFKFVFLQFVKQLRDKPSLKEMYGLVQASTFDNELNLPDDYIASLMESYPPQLIMAYLKGQFVNLTSGTIYTAYDRKLNECFDTVQLGEPLFIGMDFNVGKMAAITHVKRDQGLPRAVDELIDGYDTPDMIRRIKERYWQHDGNDFKKTCEIRIYPDASGDSRKSVNASITDLAMLRQAGFAVIAPAANPPVKDRINAMNAVFCNAQGERRYLVNPFTCPTYADGLEQQVWGANGEPDKTAGIDHANDAGGYFIHREYPIIKPVTAIKMGYAR